MRDLPVFDPCGATSATPLGKQVGTAELKARLSEYPRAVRRGETIAVLDRNTPVAEIVPVGDRGALRVRKPEPGHGLDLLVAPRHVLAIAYNRRVPC